MKIANSHEALRAAAREIFTGSLEACQVRSAARAQWRGHSAGSGYQLTLEGSGTIELAGVTQLLVIAVGKAAGTMCEALLEVLPSLPGCETRGVVIGPEPAMPLPAGFAFFAGGHPLPNQASFAGAEAALSLLRGQEATAECFCFFLISGGASAMMEMPLHAGISLADTIAFHEALIHCGAGIAEINCVRKHFSAVKGGRLRAAAGAMRTITLAVSDVPGGQLDVLGSGPTLPDASTLEECEAILGRFGLMAAFPLGVRNFFLSPECVETPKAGAWASPVAVLLSPENLAMAAQREAEALGFHVVRDDTPDDWDYRDAAVYLLLRGRALRAQHARLCLLSAGEVTVTIPAEAAVGTGGRNQQFALYLATRLEPEDGLTVVLSGGSDGVDGNSEAAGAVVDATLLEGEWLEAEEALARFDAGTFLQRFDAALHTGATGNNLRDLRLLLSVSPVV